MRKTVLLLAHVLYSEWDKPAHYTMQEALDDAEKIWEGIKPEPREPERCIQCGEADNRNGKHGPGYCGHHGYPN